MHMELAKLVGCEQADLSLDWVGLNHLGWLRRVLKDGDDLLPGLIDAVENGVAGPANIPEIQYPPGFLKALGMVPSSYVRYFYMEDEMLEAIQDKKRSRAQEVMEIEEELLGVYADGTSDTLPAILSQRGGAWYSRLAVQILEALQGAEPTVHIVNTAAAGTMSELPDDAVVEVPCAVSRDGVEPLQQAPLEESIVGLVREVKAYERLAIEAAVERSRDKALLALVANPLVPSVAVAHSVLQDMIARDLI